MIAVDSSVLLAILKGEANGAAWLKKLESASKGERLGATPVVFAEVRAFFSSEADCLAAFSQLKIALSEIEAGSAMLAGEVFREYRKQGGPRTTILPDFLIAAHAARQATALATQDRGYIRRYFPKLTLLVP